MATYLSAGSSVKGDSVKTLYLLNPSYTGYSDSSNSGNMLLVGPSTGSASQVGNMNQQQQYAGFSLPSHMSQQPHMAVMPNTNMGHQSAVGEILNNNQGYGWNGGNELLFMPSSDTREANQSLTARLNSISPGQQPSSGMSQIGMRNISQTSFQEQMPFIPSGVAITESMHAPACAGQILSLSLSSQPSLLNQMQHFPIQSSESGVISVPGFSSMGMENYPGKGERYPNQWMEGSSNSLRVSSDILVPGFQEHHIGSASNRQLSTFSAPLKVNIYTSKYLKPAQELLNEVVSIGKEVKRNSSNPSTNAESWATPNSYNTSFQDRGSVETSRKDGASITSGWPNGHDSAVAVSTMPNISEQNFGKAVNRNSTNTSMNAWATLDSYNSTSFHETTMETSRKDGGSITAAWANGKESADTISTMPNNSVDQNAENNVELTTAERQDIQTKKSKLMTMLDEVEQRYRQYNHQMQIVVASFESTAGFGAARAYTALALQTISKHFRSLKDAIKGQIRVASKALGEEESVGQERRETSRLRFIDQQLRQQRALQQLGMMQQHPWRPQRGLPERSVSVLRAWLFEHFLHPYPKDSDKVLLARQTGLTRNQVSNWFINARVRLWKPMVEEMYAEEVKDSDGAEGPDKPVQVEGEDTKGIGMMGSSGNDGVNKSLRSVTITEQKNENFPEAKMVTQEMSNEMVLLQRNSLKKSLPESLLFHEKQNMVEGAKKSTSSFLSPNLNTGLEYKSEEIHDTEMLAKLRSEERHLSDYNSPHDGIIQGENQSLGAYGVFQLNGLNRFSGEGLAASYPTNNNVSLTLGLQHSEGLTLSGNQHPYLQGHGQLQMLRRQENGMNTLNYYSMTDNNGSWQLQGFDNSR